MSLFDGLREALDPHTKNLQTTLHVHFQATNTRLERIEKAVLDAGRGDIGDHWQRFQIRKKFAAAETVEIGACPMNEIWLIQSISSDGVQEKSPAFTIEANNILIESIIKEGLGFEGIGGNQVIMPGETLFVTSRAEGNVNCTITVIRRLLPVVPIVADMGKDTEQYSPKNTHEISRDAIGQTLASVYQEGPPQLAPTEGRREGTRGPTE